MSCQNSLKSTKGPVEGTNGLSGPQTHFCFSALANLDFIFNSHFFGKCEVRDPSLVTCRGLHSEHKHANTELKCRTPC